MQKNILIILFLFCFAFLHAEQKPPIIPLPAQYQMKTGSFHVNNDVRIHYNDDLLTDEAHFLQQQLFEKKSLSLPIQKKSEENSISLILTEKEDKAGTYRMNVGNRSVKIEASTEEGIFNGMMSLMQLIEFSASNTIPCWSIMDEPKHQWRGIMLDESRHFFGKEKVKSLLDWMAFYKLNKFHWHLTDDNGWRIEIKKYPLLSLIGGIGDLTNPDNAPQFYTQDEIKEIVQYAAERKIEVIPEIDMPGHARAANRAYPAFSGGGSKQHPEFTFNPGKEETYSYLTDILKETDVLFPSQMIHLGGDEVHFGNEKWNELKEVKTLMANQNLKNLVEVEKYFMVRMADSLYALENKFLAWDEVADASFPVEKTILFWWRHDKPEQLATALEKNYPVVLCPRIPLYLDFVQHDTHQSGRRWAGAYSDLQGVYSFSSDRFAKERASQILGIQANLWTETVQTEKRFDFLMFPRISAFSESAWGTNNSFSDYEERLQQHLSLYKKQGIYYFNPFNPDEYAEPLH